VPDLVRAAAIDETPRKSELPRAYALRLAQEKARIVAEKNHAMLVLAADTVVALGRRIFPKAENGDQVRHCLELLSGRQHQVLTALAVAPPGASIRTRIVCTRVAFRRLTDAEISTYADSREGEGKAGGYAIQGRAEIFVRRLNGSYSNVVGLPLAETATLLRGLGYAC